MKTLIKLFQQLLFVAILSYGAYYLYTWYNSDDKVLMRKAETLVECFKKDSTDNMFGDKISTTELKKLLSDDFSVEVHKENFPLSAFLKQNDIKTKILLAHSFLTQSRGIVNIKDENYKIEYIKESTGEGADKKPARALVTISFKLTTENLRPNYYEDIVIDVFYLKKRGDWEVRLIRFK